MRIEVFRNFLLWCSVFNYAVLIVWFLAYTLAHDSLYELHRRWFRGLSAEQFDTLNYVLMSGYKLGILLFNLVPYIVLRIID